MKKISLCLILATTAVSSLAQAGEVLFVPQCPAASDSSLITPAYLMFSGNEAQAVFESLKATPGNHFVQYGHPVVSQVSGKQIGCEQIKTGEYFCSVVFDLAGDPSYPSSIASFSRPSFYDSCLGGSDTAQTQIQQSSLETGDAGGSIAISIHGQAAVLIEKSVKFPTCDEASGSTVCTFNISPQGILSKENL